MKESKSETTEAFVSTLEGCKKVYKQSVYAFALAISGLLAVINASINPEDRIFLPYIGCSVLMLFIAHLVFAKKYDREFSDAITAVKARQSKAEPVDADNPVNPPGNSKNQPDD